MDLTLTPPMAAARRLKRRLIQTGVLASKPTHLNVFTTDRCNFSCFYCSRNLDDTAPGVENRYEDKSEFHLADLELLLAKYPSIREVSFVGIGEPFLIKDLLPMAKYSKAQGKLVSVISNGSLLHQHWGQVGTSFDQISISLHGLTAAELKTIANVRERIFNQFVDNIRHLVQVERRLNPAMQVRASVVVLKKDLERVRHAAEFCRTNGIPELDLQNYLPYGMADCEMCLYDDEDQYRAFFDSLMTEYRGVLKINTPILVKRDAREMSWGCTTFFSMLRVDGLGQVSGCSRVMVPLAKNGSFRDDPDVWQNAYFKEMRARFGAQRDLPECCRYCPEAQ